MRTKIAVLAVAVIAVSATLGASAYTTGTVTRDANINVVNDNAGLIALTDGNSGGLVDYDANGGLSIDFTAGGADGVNPDATYELGDPTAPSTTNAFTITNLDAEAHTFTVEYSGAGAAGDGTPNIEFNIHDTSGTETTVTTVSEETTSATLSEMASGDTVYVVVSIDTTGLNSTDDLSGQFTVSA